MIVLSAFVCRKLELMKLFLILHFLFVFAGTVTWYVNEDSVKCLEEHLINIQSSDEQ